MSWDVTATVEVDGHELDIFDSNYTHNCNSMVNEALDASGYERPIDTTPGYRFDRETGARIELPTRHDRVTWWRILDGFTGHQVADALGRVLAEFERTPDHYWGMNPDNGWGDFDSLRELVRWMRDKAIDFPSSKWRFSG